MSKELSESLQKIEQQRKNTKQRFLARIVAHGLRQAGKEAQWKKSALFARDSSPRATPHHPKQPTPYCLAYKSPDTHTMVKNSGDTVRPEQTRTMKLCCHRDVLSPASLWAFGIFFSRLPLSFESFVVPFHLMVVI